MDNFVLNMNEKLYRAPGCVLSENGQCMIYQGNVRAKDGYQGISFIHPVTKRNTSQNAHRIAKMLQNYDEKGSIELGDGDASHLCHNKTCIRPDHIEIESSATNKRRKICIGLQRCTHHPKGDGQFHPDCLLHLRR